MKDAPSYLSLMSWALPDYSRNSDWPLLQEFGAKGSFIQYGGVADHALIVRGITTVYNTDYITDIELHLNGAIKVRRLRHSTAVSGSLPSTFSTTRLLLCCMPCNAILDQHHAACCGQEGAPAGRCKSVRTWCSSAAFIAGASGAVWLHAGSCLGWQLDQLLIPAVL